MLTASPSVQGVEYGMHSLKEFRSWLAGLESIGDMKAYEDMRISVCWRQGSNRRMAVYEAIAEAAVS